jgi:hypothetical protein
MKETKGMNKESKTKRKKTKDTWRKDMYVYYLCDYEASEDSSRRNTSIGFEYDGRDSIAWVLCIHVSQFENTSFFDAGVANHVPADNVVPSERFMGAHENLEIFTGIVTNDPTVCGDFHISYPLLGV